MSAWAGGVRLAKPRRTVMPSHRTTTTCLPACTIPCCPARHTRALQDLVWWLSDNLEPFLLPNREQQLLDYQAVTEELAKAGNPNAHLVSAALAAMAAAPQAAAGNAAPGGGARGSGGGDDVVMAEAGPASGAAMA